VGEHIGAKALAGVGLGEGLSFTLKALGDFERVNTYGLKRKPSADAAVKLELLNFLDGVVMLPGLNQVSGQGSASSFLDQYQERYPSTTDVSLAGKLTLSVDAGALSFYSADVTLGEGAGVTLKGDSAQGTTHYYVANPSSVDIYINLSAEGQGQVSQWLAGGASGEAVLSMRIEPKAQTVPWVPTSVEVDGTLEGDLSGVAGETWAQLMTGLGAKAKAALASSLAGLSVKFSGSVGLKGKMTQTLDLVTHPQDALDLYAFFDAYEKALDKNATDADLKSLEAAGQKFAQDFLRDADGNLFIYLTNKAGVTVSFQMGTVFVDGASAGIDGTTEHLLLAIYKNDAGEWVPSTSCAGSPTLTPPP
jgi:hypothetical protein